VLTSMGREWFRDNIFDVHRALKHRVKLKEAFQKELNLYKYILMKEEDKMF